MHIRTVHLFHYCIYFFIFYFRQLIDLTKIDYCPLKPCVTFELKPSLGSAFYPLHQQRGDAVNGEVSPVASTSSSVPLVPAQLVPDETAESI